MGSLLQDFRFALRTLSKAPGFSLVVVVTLALGIGANTAIFTLMDQVLLRGLPVERPGELVVLDAPGSNMGRFEGGSTSFSYPMYRDFRTRGTVFSGILARFPVSLTMLYQNQSDRVSGDLVSGNYFNVLGVRPRLGRAFTSSDEETPGEHPVAVLSHGFWTTRFGADPGVIGKTIRLNNHPMMVVGVAPIGFTGTEVGRVPDIFVPLMMKAKMTPAYDGLENRRYMWLNLMARLRPGTSRDQAEAGLNVLFRQIRQQELTEMPARSARFSKAFLETRLLVLPGAKGLSDLRDRFSTPIVVLMTMVGLVLLIACANVANLLMARAPSRQREFAIRLALGASRGRVIRQLLVESLVLALTGGALGVIVAAWTGDLLVRALPTDHAAQAFSSSPDARVLLFALAASVVTGVLFGLVPAWQTARPQLVTSLKEDGGSVLGAGHVRLRKGLVVAQVLLSMVLLVGAGLFVRTLWNLRSFDPGFTADRLLTFSVDPGLSGYTPVQMLDYYRRLQEGLARQPGVVDVSLAASTPLTGNLWITTVTVEGYEPKEGEDLNPHANHVGPRFFETMGTPIIAGRGFTDRDGRGAPRVAVISETMARYFFGTQNPVGRHFGVRRGQKTDIEIVGVARDNKDTSLRDATARVFYLPYAQAEDMDLGQMSFFVRIGAAGVTGDTLRRVVRQIDASIPVFDLKTMTAVADEGLFLDRMVALLSACFGVLATLLAAIGLYGVMSYAVARRTREIGLRVALGAPKANVLWLVMKEVSTLAVSGVALGVPTALAMSRLVQAQLFGVSATDPVTLTVAPLTLLAVAFVAGYIPASRAAHVDPMQALRRE